MPSIYFRNTGDTLHSNFIRRISKKKKKVDTVSFNAGRVKVCMCIGIAYDSFKVNKNY